MQAQTVMYQKMREVTFNINCFTIIVFLSKSTPKLFLRATPLQVIYSNDESVWLTQAEFNVTNENLKTKRTREFNLRAT